MYKLSYIENENILDLEFKTREELEEVLFKYTDSEINNKEKYAVYVVFNNSPLKFNDYNSQQTSFFITHDPFFIDEFYYKFIEEDVEESDFCFVVFSYPNYEEASMFIRDLKEGF